jgi:hypothetical protein
MAQIGFQVMEGETHVLAVIPVPGESYEWTIYDDYTLLVRAGTDEAVFLTARTEPSASVLWKKSGTYFYTVTAVNARGCMNLKVGMVQVNKSEKKIPVITITTDKNPACSGELVKFTATVVNPSLYQIFSWYKNGNHTGSNSCIYSDASLKDKDVVYCVLTVLETRTSPLIINSNEITMRVLNTKAAFTVSERFDEMNGKIYLNNQSTDADTYQWDFGNGQTSTEENPVEIYYSDGAYLIRLIAASQYNCMDTAYFMYEMLFKGLFIPNAFVPGSLSSPANLFKPAGINLKNYRIEVYDNWGHLLWESTSLDENGRPTEGWDGTFKGNLMPQGTYMWKASGVFRDNSEWTGSDIGKGKKSTMGTVTLIR